MFRIRRLTKQSTGECQFIPDRLESFSVKFLWYEANTGTGLTIVPDDIMAINRHHAGTGIYNAADDTDQSSFAGTIGTEQCDDLAIFDFQTDIFKRLEAGLIGFRKVCDGYYRVHISQK